MDRMHQRFIGANASSPVVRIATGSRTTTYHLQDGSSFRLDGEEMAALSRLSMRGHTINLCDAMRRRLGDYGGR